MVAVKRGGELKNTLKKAVALYRREGISGIKRGITWILDYEIPPQNYQTAAIWVAPNDLDGPSILDALTAGATSRKRIQLRDAVTNGCNLSALAAPVEAHVLVDQPCTDPISYDVFRGTHPLVKLREDTCLHREVISPNLGRAGLTLEIGPYYRPVVKGPSARYFDVFDTEELKRRADEDSNTFVTADTVPDMHYSDPHGDIATIPETFSEVFSSHCIEHQPDLISHFEKVYDLLELGGRYIAFVPDKRFCFDHFLPYSSVGDILLASVINLVAGRTHNDAPRHWAGDHADPDYMTGYPDRIATALEIFDDAKGKYIVSVQPHHPN